LASFTAPGDTRRAILRMAGFGVAWAVLEAGVAGRMQGSYHLLQVVWCRYAVHLATLGLLFGWRRPDKLWTTGRPGYQMTRSMMMLVMPASFVMALDVGMASNTTWSVFWLSPVLIIVIARAVLGERASWSPWAMAAIGAAVVVFMFDPLPPASLPLLMIPVVMALSFSVYVVMTRSLSSERVLANLFYTAFGVFLALTPLMPIVWATPSWHDAAVLIGIGVLGLVALFALDRSASLAPVSATAPILYLQVVGLALVEFLDGHSLSRRTLAGAAVIVAMAGYQWLQDASRDVVPDGRLGALAKDPAR
jgi:drug/metabolite transporter (DMT)-like permease